MKHPTRAFDPCSRLPFALGAAAALLAASACGGGAGGSDGDAEENAVGGDAADDGLTSPTPPDLLAPASPFDEIIVTSFGGYYPQASQGEACNTFSHENRFTFDQQSGSLRWSWCRAGELLEGTRSLDGAEFTRVLDAYSSIGRATGTCGSDEPFGWLDVRSDGAMSRFAPATMSCYEGFEDEAYVDQLGFFDLLSLLQDLSD